jgi:hypothetical protein
MLYTPSQLVYTTAPGYTKTQNFPRLVKTKVGPGFKKRLSDLAPLCSEWLQYNPPNYLTYFFSAKDDIRLLDKG